MGIFFIEFFRINEKIPIWVWHKGGSYYKFVAEKSTDMTDEERQLIIECRVMIVGEDKFIGYVRDELEQIGFTEILNVPETETFRSGSHTGIVIGQGDSRFSYSVDCAGIPVIYAFDFIEGAGAFVLFPDDDRDFLRKHDIRVWAAEYMLGYCAFWCMDGSEWLLDALPAIKEGKTSEEAQRTAAHMCARIAANIAVGREVKHYPRFYLVKLGDSLW